MKSIKCKLNDIDIDGLGINLKTNIVFPAKPDSSISVKEK